MARPNPIATQSEEETTTVGRELAATLSAGDVLLLYGDLGAGKTAFVRGLAEGLGVDRAEVSSATFTLIDEYRGGRLRCDKNGPGGRHARVPEVLHRR